MNPTGLRALALLAAAAAAGCGENLREPEPLRVNARSGAAVDLSRTTWGPVCVELAPVEGQPPRSISRRIVHGDDGVVSYSDQVFGQAACAGAPLGQPGSISWLATEDGGRAVSWSGTKPVPEFPDAPVATRVFLENQIALRGEAFWLDDVSSPRVLYASPDVSTPDPDGYPSQISAAGYTEVR